MKIKLLLSLLFFLLYNTLPAQVKLNESIDVYGSEGNAISISRDGNIIAIGSVRSSKVSIFEWSDSTWKEVAIFTGDRRNDNFGFSISLSANGKRLAVGAPGTENDAETMHGRGYVRVFESDGKEWKKVGQDIIGDSAINLFGWATAFSEDGNSLAVSAPQHSHSDTKKLSMEGVVKIFHFKDSLWQQTGANIYGDQGSYSGHALAISADGNTVAIGKKYGTSVAIYTLKNSNWILSGNPSEDTESSMRFGFSISLSDNGKKIAIGSPFTINEDYDECGSIKIYSKKLGRWKQEGQTILGEGREQYGFSVSLSGNGKILSTSIRKTKTRSDICQLYILQHKKWNKYGYTMFEDKQSIFFESFVALSKDGYRVIIGTEMYDMMGGRVSVYDIRPVNIVVPPTHK